MREIRMSGSMSGSVETEHGRRILRHKTGKPRNGSKPKPKPPRHLSTLPAAVQSPLGPELTRSLMRSYQAIAASPNRAPRSSALSALKGSDDHRRRRGRNASTDTEPFGQA